MASEKLNFDAYMVGVQDLQEGEFRLLEVDNRVTLPNFSPIRLLVRRADVLHA